ncbi:MAG TPA: TIGR03936 family radical SAM-associated protein [Acidothermaceae bacterium]
MARTQRQPDARDVAPAVQRLRVHFAKRGRLRFTSHRDFQRVFERAVRRAAVPVAYSGGFSPHPRISYLGAAATGAASEAEYLEISLTRRCDPAQIRQTLDDALPAGFDVVEVVEPAPGGEPLADRINASHWLVVLGGVSTATVARAVETFMAAQSVPVERLLKDGRRTLDARSAVVALTVSGEPIGDTGGVAQSDEPDRCAILDMVVRHLTPAVRPDDVLAGLRQVSDLPPQLSPMVTRLAQGLLDENGRLADPLAPDRAAAADSLAAAGESAV